MYTITKDEIHRESLVVVMGYASEQDWLACNTEYRSDRYIGSVFHRVLLLLYLIDSLCRNLVQLALDTESAIFVHREQKDSTRTLKAYRPKWRESSLCSNAPCALAKSRRKVVKTRKSLRQLMMRSLRRVCIQLLSSRSIPSTRLRSPFSLSRFRMVP